MEKNLWDNITDAWGTAYGMSLIWTISAIIGLLFAIRFYKGNLIHRLFIVYFLISIFISDGVYEILKHIFGLQGISRSLWLETLNIIFAEIETLLFLIFFKKYLNNKYYSRLIKGIIIVFTLVATLALLYLHSVSSTFKEIRRISYYLNVLELFILIPFCLKYYYKILSSQINKITYLTESPAFWIITGLFFYGIISLPILIISDTLVTHNKVLYFIGGAAHYFSACLLLISIAKAFSCNTILTK